jgi:hypothetical protein
MWCEKCGERTTVKDTRTSADLDGDARVRVALMALGKDVAEHVDEGKARLRLRWRRCTGCGHEQATVEMTAGAWEGRR